MRSSQPGSLKGSKRIELNFLDEAFFSCSALVCFEIFCPGTQYAQVLHQHKLKMLSDGYIYDPLN